MYGGVRTRQSLHFDEVLVCIRSCHYGVRGARQLSTQFMLASTKIEEALLAASFSVILEKKRAWMAENLNL